MKRINIIKFVVIITICLCGVKVILAQQGSKVQVIPDVIYGYKDGMALTMDVFKPEFPTGAAVIFVNSGGFISPAYYRQCVTEEGKYWALGDHTLRLLTKNEIIPNAQQQISFEPLLNNGFTVFDVRHGSAPKYMLNEIVEDLNKAIKYIKADAGSFNISKDRIGIWGTSAGGYLSAYLAVNPAKGNNLKASVLFFPAGFDFLAPQNDTIRVVLPSLHISEQLLDSLSLHSYMKENLPPTLIMYGEYDRDFITIDSDQLYEGLKSNNNVCDKIIFKKAGHMWMDNKLNYNKEVGDKAIDNMVSWFLKYL